MVEFKRWMLFLELTFVSSARGTWLTPRVWQHVGPTFLSPVSLQLQVDLASARRRHWHELLGDLGQPQAESRREHQPEPEDDGSALALAEAEEISSSETARDGKDSENSTGGLELDDDFEADGGFCAA